MIYFLLSLAALFAAPAIFSLVKRLGGNLIVLERIAFVCIVGMVVIHIFPESLAAAGWLAVVSFCLGLLLPVAMEKLLHHHEGTHLTIIILIVLGIAVHGLMDGAALGLSYKFGADMSRVLPLAILLHRIPAALVLWWILRPKYGLIMGWSVLILLAVTTSMGFWTAQAFVMQLHTKWYVAVFQSLVGGSMVHLVIHRTEANDH